MKIIKNCCFLIFAIWGLQACIDEIYLRVPATGQVLVIDGWLGANSKETVVKVYKTSSFTSGAQEMQYLTVPVKRIYLEYEDGKQVDFWQLDTAISTYAPIFDEEFPSESRYRLRIVTKDEGEIQSDWVWMPKNPEPQGLEFKTKEKPVVIFSNGEPITQMQVFTELSLAINYPEKEEVGFYIQTRGISEVYTSSENDNCSCVCYINVSNIYGGINLKGREFYAGNSTAVSLGEIPVNSLGRYYINSTIRTVSAESLAYLQEIDKQQRNTGSIFDPSPSRIQGNFKNLDYPEEVVLGNFIAFREASFEEIISRASIYRDNIDLKFMFEPLYLVESSCTEYYIEATDSVPNQFMP